MLRNTAMLALCCSTPFMFGAPTQESDARTPAPPPVRVHLVHSGHDVEPDWYDDVFVHAIGDEIVAKDGQALTAKQRGDTKKVRLRCVRSKENNALDVVVGSVQGHRYSGDELRFHFEHDANGTPQARVTGHWKSDMKRAGSPADGDLDDVRGDVWLNSADFKTASPLSIKFAVTTNWNTVPVVLMGALGVPDP
jgi:hypothetical protein